MGPFIVTFAVVADPVKDPFPVPVQPLKIKPGFGVAVICWTVPLFKNWLDGVTTPPLEAFIVNWY
jgi:hypothetical protein